jgi:hypothetical protein
MLQSLASQTNRDFDKVVGIPPLAFRHLVAKFTATLMIHPGPQHILNPAAQVLTYMLYLRHYTRPRLAAVYMGVGKTTIHYFK